MPSAFQPPLRRSPDALHNEARITAANLWLSRRGRWWSIPDQPGPGV